MEYDNFEKVEEMVKEVLAQEELLFILDGHPTVTITRQFRNEEIVLDLNKSYVEPEDFKVYAEEFVQSMKERGGITRYEKGMLDLIKKFIGKSQVNSFDLTTYI